MRRPEIFDGAEMNPRARRSNGKVVPTVATPGDFFDGAEMSPGVEEGRGRYFPRLLHPGKPPDQFRRSGRRPETRHHPYRLLIHIRNCW